MRKVIVEAYMEVSDEYADTLKELVHHTVDNTSELYDKGIFKASIKLRIDEVVDITEVVKDVES